MGMVQGLYTYIIYIVLRDITPVVGHQLDSDMQTGIIWRVGLKVFWEII